MRTTEQAAIVWGYSSSEGYDNPNFNQSVESFKEGVNFAQEWISVEDELPEESKFEMSEDVLTLAGSKYSVKCYDHNLGKWSGSANVTVTHWRPIERK